MSIKDDIEAALRHFPDTGENTPIGRGLTELRRIVEALPVTADGVPVVPGKDMVYRMVHAGRGEYLPRGFLDTARYLIDKSYSNPEAAEAAHRLANGPHDHDDADGRAG